MTISSYFRNQVNEIAGDPRVRCYGAAIALTNAVTAVFWLTNQPLDVLLAPDAPTVCWPFFENCYRWRSLSGDSIALVMALTLVLAVVNAWLFLDRRTVPIGWTLLLLMTCLKVAILTQDFRLAMNQHYMSLWIAGVFLFVPGRRFLIPRLIVCFYLAAGLLKINPGWLSGAALTGRRPFGMPPEWIGVACVYVLFLELFVSWLLVSRNKWLAAAALLQFVLFHIGSFWVVGFFYPLLMFLILSIFVLELWPLRPPGDRLLSVPTRTRACAWAVILVFWCLQAFPLAFRGDTAITGEGRMFALNMFDAPIECRATATLRHKEHGSEVLTLGAPLTQARLACDPILHFEIAKALCRIRHSDPDFQDLDLRLESHKIGDAKVYMVVDLAAVCSSNVSYSFFHHNPWIRVN